MKELNISQLSLVSGGDFIGVFASGVSLMAFGAVAGSIFDNIPLLTPLGETFCPRIECVATQTAVGGLIFGVSIGTAWLVARALDDYCYSLNAPATNNQA